MLFSTGTAEELINQIFLCYMKEGKLWKTQIMTGH